MWHVLVTPTLLIPLNHWMQSHSNTELFLNWLNTFPSTLIISTIPILNMHVLVLITLYKCVHAYLEKYPDKMYNDVFPWTVKSVLNSPAHCFAHNPLFFAHGTQSLPQISCISMSCISMSCIRDPDSLCCPLTKSSTIGCSMIKCAWGASHNVPTHCAQHNGTQPSHIHERVFYPISIFTKELSF